MITDTAYKQISAVFQGKDGSLGYRNNHIYQLRLYLRLSDTGNRWLVQSTGKEGSCYYDSEKAFLKNWMTSRKVLVEKKGHPTIG